MKLSTKLGALVAATFIGVLGIAPTASAAMPTGNEAPQRIPNDPSVNPLAENENCSKISQFLVGNKACTGADLVLGVKKAPVPQSPTADVGDLFPALRPLNAPDGSPFAEGGPTMLASSGLGGFAVSNYDLPGTDDVVGSAEAVGQTATANTIEQVSLTITGATAMIERYAYDPADLTQFLAEFTEKAMELVKAKLWLPYIGIGLLLTSALALLNSGVRGRIRDALWATVWSVIVLGAAGILMLNAVSIQNYLQSETTGVVAGFNSASSPAGVTGNVTNDNLSAYGANSHGIVLVDPKAMSDVATDAQIRSIHFQGWCRREFGSTSTATVRDYCAKMWEAQRYSFFDQAQIDADQSADGSVRKAIRERKADQWSKWAGEIQTKDSAAYSCMQGIGCNRIWNAAIELGFTFFASLFRVFAALLLLVCGAVFIGYAIAFVAASPVIVNNVVGQELGIAIFKGMFRTFVYALFAGVGSWFYMLWTQLALQPGMSDWWSGVLLVVGTIVAWGLLRPDRKILNLLSFGKVRGYGKLAGKGLDKLLTFAAGKYIADEAAEKVNFTPRDDRPAQQERAENFRHATTPGYVPASVFTPAIGNAPVVHEGVVLEKGSNVEKYQHSPDVYEPSVIPGEVIDSGTYDRTGTPSPETDDYDGSDDIELYEPQMREDAQA